MFAFWSFGWKDNGGLFTALRLRTYRCLGLISFCPYSMTCFAKKYHYLFWHLHFQLDSYIANPKIAMYFNFQYQKLNQKLTALI